jgi:hypothetical protein
MKRTSLIEKLVKNILYIFDNSYGKAVLQVEGWLERNPKDNLPMYDSDLGNYIIPVKKIRTHVLRKAMKEEGFPKLKTVLTPIVGKDELEKNWDTIIRACWEDK